MKDKFAVTVCRTVCVYKTYLFPAEDKDDAAEQALAIAELDDGPGWETQFPQPAAHSVSGIEYIPESGTVVIPAPDLSVGDQDEAE